MSRNYLSLTGALLAWFATGAGAAPLPRPAHVVLVIEENRSFQTLIGNNKEAPYINQLAGEGALLTQSFAITHPSEPNYLALFGGDTQGLADDSCPHDYGGSNLASALAERKLSFVIYSEDLPATGFSGCASDNKLYRRKHNPVPNYGAVPADANRAFSDFPADYSKLPTVAYVVPNMMDDMHDGTVAQADSWLKAHLDAYIRWAKQHNSVLILTWDEDDGTQNNQIPTIVIGAGVKRGHYAQHVDHYDVLRTLADMYGAAPPGHAAEGHDITGVWKK